MEATSLNIIRESTRNLIKLNRRLHRDEVTNSRRSIVDVRKTPEDVSAVANKLKTKSSITIPELQILKNGLVEDLNNIDAVLNTHGALRGLVRELSGRDDRKQCLAAGCACNLALNTSAAHALAKAAGAYLVAALPSLANELTVTCAWALGNLAGGGSKVCQVLVAQGAVAALTEALGRGGDVGEASAYALLHVAYQLRDDLRRDHLDATMKMLSKVGITETTAQLLFVLSCHKDFTSLEDPFLEKLLEELPTTIEEHLKCKNMDLCCKLVYEIRILGNLILKDNLYRVLTNFLDKNKLYIKLLLNLNNGVIRDSLFWFLGNLLNYHNDVMYFNNLLLL